MNNPQSGPPGYSLILGEGIEWWMSSDTALSPWLKKLASILELNPCRSRGSPKFIFTASGNGSCPKICHELLTGDQNLDDSDHTWSEHGRRSLRFWRNNQISDVVCEIRDRSPGEMEYINMLVSLEPVYQQCVQAGGLPFHSTLAEFRGGGILLAASGNMGKSTCFQRLPEPWKPLCDDEVLVVREPSGIFFAHPFPTWSNYLRCVHDTTQASWNVQAGVPLKAVFFLEQSETDQISALGKGEAAVLMTQSAIQVSRKFKRDKKSAWKAPEKNKMFDNACLLAKKVPAYWLKVSLTGNFWEGMERVLAA
ncbi:SynChlorMet cassette protein ScmC [Fibrobacterota bacterium]